MKQLLIVIFLSMSCGLFAQTYSWESCRMDGHRTGARAITGDVESSIGKVKGRCYYSPSGKIYKGGTVPAVVGIVSGVQEQMASVKEVIGVSLEYMERMPPECALSDMATDWLLESVEKLSGKKTDLSILNFGGIRVDMPKGNIIVDDIKSMFPFKNKVVHVTLPGRRVREVFEQMVSKTGIQAFGGVRLTVEDKRIVSIEVGGEPLDDEKIYGLATIDFLLNGGDKLYLSTDAIEVSELDKYLGDVFLDKVKTLTAEGKMIEYKMDNRLVRR